MLKGSGNAIVPALAAEFIMAFCEAAGDIRVILTRTEKK
jgi:hypothetical protein